MLRGGKNATLRGLSYNGCSCHNTKASHRKAKKHAKIQEEKIWRKEVITDF